MAFELLNNPTDDRLFESVSRHDELLPLLRELAPVTPVRAEAMLHAHPPSAEELAETWIAPFRGRWERVEEEMRNLVAVGVSAPRHTIDQVAESAVAAAGEEPAWASN